MRIAVLGCGQASEKYLQQLARYQATTIAGFHDLVPARIQDFTLRFGGKAYRDLPTLLSDPAIELVLILTTPDSHFALASTCLSAGKHVYCEKPLATGYEQALALSELARDHAVQ